MSIEALGRLARRSASHVSRDWFFGRARSLRFIWCCYEIVGSSIERKKAALLSTDMPAPELQIGNRTAYLRKAITTPDFKSERVLARDAFQFAGLWLKRECPKALPFWEQFAQLLLGKPSSASAVLTTY
jgi:hypothetical protein